VSKKLTGIHLAPIELEIGGEAPAKGAKALQEFVASGFSRDAKLADVSDMDFDLIAFPKLERFDDSDGKADRETVSPFGDLHDGCLR
jgi:hypothetical protein